MIEYIEIPEEMKKELEAVAATDEFGTLDSETVYKGIRNSTGTDKFLAEAYEVEIDLVKKSKI
jgi:hypothetical protein